MTPTSAPDRSLIFTHAELDAALQVVRAAMLPTPQYAWPLLARRAGAELWVKHENHAPTGAFKVRGGLTYVDRLVRDRPHVRGLISATRGNHGQSIAFAAARHALPVTIVVPVGNSIEKNAAMLGLGATLHEEGADFQAARETAEAMACAEKLEMVPSFHPDLVIGVATYAFELLSAVPDLHRLYVPIGLGSGICGCIGVRNLLGLKTEIVGVQASDANAYALSLVAGRPVETATSNTCADGMAVRVPDPAAFDIIKAGVADIVEVNDDAIAEAIRIYWTDTHNLAEGAGAAGLAAVLQDKGRNSGKRVSTILSGGNIDLDLFRNWVLPPRTS